MTHPNRRHALKALSALAAGASLPLSSRAQAFPSRPIKLIIPHAAGGNSDAFGRIVAQKLSERIGQQVVVDNKPGAGGTIACAMVAKSPADGYTLVVADNGTQAIAPTLYGSRLHYDVFKDFTPITLAASFPALLLVHPSLPVKNAKEFVALVKSQPGKVTYSSAGTGNGSHLTLEMFRAAAGGLNMVHVPYKGGAPAVQALLAGEVQLTAVSVNTALPHVQSGKARAIGVASAKRSPALPDVPTFNEAGIPFEADNWLAILGPAGIPADVVSKLNAELTATMRSPDVQERLAKLGLEVVASPPDEVNKILAKEVPKWGKAVKDSGAVAE
jgi:tripartite-type tricarboxylate transporter receptor subunit TctC